LNKAIELFDNDKMQVNAPIIIGKITSELDKIEGVQSIASITFNNEIDTNLGYSGIVYPIQNAIRSGVLYPSVDVCIFEVKYPRSDIRVRTIDI
jgi:hypothetical protein